MGKLTTSSAKADGDYQYTLCPEGTHAAVCVAVVDLGTQPPSPKFPEAGPRRKLYLVWELTEEPNRLLIGKDYTASLHEKATLRKDIEKWRGRKFGESEDFDPKTLAGKKCLLTVAHTKGETKYHTVTGVAAPMRGQQIKDAQVTPFTFDLDDNTPFHGPAWDLPYWYGKPIEEVVADCPEMRKRSGRHEDIHPEDGDQGGDNEIPF